MTQAQDEIAEKKEQIKEAQEKLDSIAEPSYDVYTRRETPWSEGYVSYETNASVFRTSVISSLLSSTLLLPWLPL